MKDKQNGMVRPRYSRTQTVALTGLFGALALVLSMLENALPSLPLPGAKMGLANVVILLALYVLDRRCAACIALIKVGFALFRGVTAFLMSGAGTLLAVLLMLAVKAASDDGRRFSAVGVGVAGAVGHNAGQWLMAMVLLGSALFDYVPLLLLLAVPAGVITGLIAQLVINKLNNR